MRLPCLAVLGGFLSVALARNAEARKLAVVVTENEGLPASDVRAATTAALDILTGNVDLGDEPDKLGELLKSRGSDPLKCGGDAVCIAKLGVEASSTYVLALGMGALAGDYTLSASLVDVAHQKVAVRKSVALDAKPDWPEAMRDLLRQTLPEGTIRYESKLRITADLAGADIFIDGRSVGTTPIAKPIATTAGSHEIRIEKQGYRTFASNIDVEPTGVSQVEAKLPLLPPVEVPSPYRPSRIAAFGAGGLTVAGIVVSVILQLKVNDASNAYVQTCQQWAINPAPCTNGGAINLPPSQQSEYARLQQLQSNESAASTRFAVSVGATIAVAAATGVLIYYDLTHGPVPVAVAAGPSGFSLTAHF